jgi:hypothetical protein
MVDAGLSNPYLGSDVRVAESAESAGLNELLCDVEDPILRRRLTGCWHPAILARFLVEDDPLTKLPTRW